jgi:hypothetical protein
MNRNVSGFSVGTAKAADTQRPELVEAKAFK